MADEAPTGLSAAFRSDAPAAQLVADGLAVCDGFAAPPRIRDLFECLQRRRHLGQFAPARIGVGSRAQRREEIRGDWTCWLSEPLYPPERALLTTLDELRLQLNRESLLGLFDLELHYAWYPPGLGYMRHIDQPHGRQQRKVSVILYLNESWELEAGGQLRIFDVGNTHRDIEPIGGRLVCFLTDGREHAVLPAIRDRCSLSGWFRCRTP